MDDRYKRFKLAGNSLGYIYTKEVCTYPRLLTDLS